VKIGGLDIMVYYRIWIVTWNYRINYMEQCITN